MVNKNSLVEDILILLDKLSRELLPTVPKDFLSLDITMPQTKIMLLLYLQGPKRMSSIACELDVTLPTASSLVERLVEKKYVIREMLLDDRRVVLCCLSKAGQEAISRIWQSSRNKAREILDTLDTSKLELFNEVIQAMYETATAKLQTVKQS